MKQIHDLNKTNRLIEKQTDRQMNTLTGKATSRSTVVGFFYKSLAAFRVRKR